MILEEEVHARLDQGDWVRSCKFLRVGDLRQGGARVEEDLAWQSGNRALAILAREGAEPGSGSWSLALRIPPD